MEAYANALLFAIPIFMLLVLAEIIYGHFKGMQTYTFMDTISSLSSGLTNIIKELAMTNKAPSKVSIFGTSLQIKKPKTIANTRLKYLMGVTKDASASL